MAQVAKLWWAKKYPARTHLLVENRRGLLLLCLRLLRLLLRSVLPGGTLGLGCLLLRLDALLGQRLLLCRVLGLDLLRRVLLVRLLYVSAPQTHERTHARRHRRRKKTTHEGT